MSENLNQVDVTIQIAGSTCDYETLTLHQSMHGHHSFEILVNYKPNKPSLWSTTPETVFEQLGVSVDIKMEHLVTG
jgi:type VI secretion system secreted protein VgrG